MAKMILGFLALFGFVFLGIQGFIAATGREKIQLIKTLSYTMLVVVLVALIIGSIVILF